mgnify:CR=1 FL=1
MTHAATQVNAYNLAPTFLEAVLSRYHGTRLGRQELDGELIEDRPDALWTRDMIESARVAAVPPLQRIVVAVDPQPERPFSGHLTLARSRRGENLRPRAGVAVPAAAASSSARVGGSAPTRVQLMAATSAANSYVMFEGDGTVGWLLMEMDKIDYSAYRPPVSVLPLGTVAVTLRATALVVVVSTVALFDAWTNASRHTFSVATESPTIGRSFVVAT